MIRNASTDTQGSGDLDFAGNTPVGEVLPAEERRAAPPFRGELLDGTACTSTSPTGRLPAEPAEQAAG